MPLVVLVTLALLASPLPPLVDPIGAWIASVRRGARPTWTSADIPMVFGGLTVVTLSLFVG